MRRFVTLVFLLLLALPAGITLVGCTRNPAANYCNGSGYGPKVTDVYSITLQPQNIGISLAFGQTHTLTPPTSTTCKGAQASSAGLVYGTTNNQLVDISPNGTVCAGTWNRNSGGGIPDFTVCNPPKPLPTASGLPYGSAFVTASVQSVTSNPIQVFVHAPVTSLSLVGPTQCLSQTEQFPKPLDVEACYAGPNNASYELCAPLGTSTFSCKSGLAPGVTSVPICKSAIGTLSYNTGNSNVASINPETNIITAQAPGTTVITASVAGSGSSAGYFSTCPPASIELSFNGSTNGTVTQGVPQNLVTKIVDTKGHAITGLQLDYQSTNRADLFASVTGQVVPLFPGAGSVFAVCQPSTCNPAPINQVGVNGTGLSIASNPVNLTIPGTASSNLWFAAPGKSQYIVPLQLITGTLGSTVRLPYVPNSMVMDAVAQNIYLGSEKALMTFSTSSNTVTAQNQNYPGVVLAVTPDGGTVLVNDQIRQIFYLVGTGSASTTATFSGMGSSAQWTPDGRTLYITDSADSGAGHSNMLYVYNLNTGWTTHPLPSSGGTLGPQRLALTVPSVGAYLSGSPTVAHTWCPVGTPGNYSSLSFYPEGDAVNVNTEALSSTSDGQHILGAAALGAGGTAGPLSFSDIGVAIPSSICPTAANGALLPLTINHTLNQTTLNVSATAVNQVVTTPAAVNQGSPSQYSLSFITYTGNTAGASLPYYKQTTAATSSLGTVGYVTLAAPSTGTGPLAPIAGTFSPDATTFFVSTSGDNRIHFIDTQKLTDTQQITPNLPACSAATDIGCTLPSSVTGTVPATSIMVKPRSTT